MGGPHRHSMRIGAVVARCRGAWRCLGRVLWKFWQDECPQRAAALAYATLLSLVPSLAVAFAMLKAFGGLRPIQERLEGLVYTHLVTDSSLQAAEYIRRFTERVHAGAIGSIGFLAFIATSVALLNTVAGAFNRVWGVEEQRSLKDRSLTFFALTLLGPVLFGASISITATIRQWIVWTWWPIPGARAALGLLVPFLLTWSGFFLLYEAIPSVPLRLRPALLGSLTVAASWELVKVGFEWYVGHVVDYGKVYASLSVVPIFLLWLYVSWVVALLGFEIAFFAQHPEALRDSANLTGASRPASIPDAIRTFVGVVDAFVNGEGPVAAGRLCERMALPEGTVVAALHELERRGYLARVAAGGGFLPCRHPASVSIAEMWQALGGRMGVADGDELDRLLASAAGAAARVLGSTTVQDLVGSRASAGARASGLPGARVTEIAG